MKRDVAEVSKISTAISLSVTTTFYEFPYHKVKLLGLGLFPKRHNTEIHLHITSNFNGKSIIISFMISLIY